MHLWFWLVSEIEIVSSSDNDGPVLHEEVDYLLKWDHSRSGAFSLVPQPHVVPVLTLKGNMV